MKTVAHHLFLACLLCSALLGSAPRISAQGGVPLWTNVSSGVGSTAVDSNGNIFVTGSGITKYSDAGAPLWTNLAHALGPVVVNKNGNAFTIDSWFDGGNYFALLAYSSAGVPLWTNGFAPDSAILQSLAVDDSGNVFVTGSSSSASCCPGSYLTMKYSNTGVPLWTNRYKELGNNYSSAAAIALDRNGDVFVTGGSAPQTATHWYYVTIKYSNAGVPLWTNRYDLGVPGQTREVRSIAVDGSGNVFITGDSSKTSDYDYGTIAYSNSGTPLWINNYNGPGNSWDVARAVAVDANGNVFVTGYSSTTVFDPTYGYLYDYATIKYSNSGVPQWTNYYDGPANFQDYASAITVDGDGNVFVTGTSFDGPCCTSVAAFETIAYSNAGNLLWQNRYYGPDNFSITPVGIAVDRAGNVIVTGNSSYSTTIKFSSSLRQPVHLDFQKLNNQLVLSWINAGFNLQSAPFASGTFTNIPGATSPYTNSFTAPRQFFRLAQ